VFSTGVDPVRFGLAQALDRPGGNLTGFTLLAGEIVSRKLQLAREVAPDAGISLAPQNFKALFESIEAYQVARGVLRA
jgi:hypothetical protein